MHQHYSKLGEHGSVGECRLPILLLIKRSSYVLSTVSDPKSRLAAYARFTWRVTILPQDSGTTISIRFFNTTTALRFSGSVPGDSKVVEEQLYQGDQRARLLWGGPTSHLDLRPVLRC